MEFFESLIHDFGQLIEVPLHLDKLGCCLLNVDDTLKIQISHYDKRESLLIACPIAELPAGKLRENILRDALKANNEYPKVGNFSYSPKNNLLVLFVYIPERRASAPIVAKAFNEFAAKADSWRKAIDSGHTYTLLTGSPGGSVSNP